MNELALPISLEALQQESPIGWLGFELYYYVDSQTKQRFQVFQVQMPIAASESYPERMAAFTPGIARIDASGHTHSFSGLHKTPEVIPDVERAYFDDAYYSPHKHEDVFPKRVQIEALPGAHLTCIVSPGDVEVRPRSARESTLLPGIHLFIVSPIEADVRPFKVHEVQGMRAIFTWE